jgi:hypothetical protein
MFWQKGGNFKGFHFIMSAAITESDFMQIFSKRAKKKRRVYILFKTIRKLIRPVKLETKDLYYKSASTNNLEIV